MKAFRDGKRRAKQQVLQRLGVVQGSEDAEFSAEWSDYRSSVNALKSIQNAMRAHLKALRQAESTAAALAVELAAFHQDTKVMQQVGSFANARAELETVQFASVERLYEAEVNSAPDMLLWQYPELEQKVKKRKKLLLDYDSYLNRLEQSKVSLANSQNQGPSANGGKQKKFGKKRSELELQEEVATRKIKVEQAEAAVNDSTEWLFQQFHDLAKIREEGTILATPIACILACQQHLASSLNEKLSKAKLEVFQSKKNDFLQRLSKLDAEHKAGQSLDLEGFAHMTNTKHKARMSRLRPAGHCFGQPLADESVPPIVCDAIDYLERNGGLLTEGLFRVPGNMMVVATVKGKYDKGEADGIKSADCTPHDVATLLKLYLRELPEPLITTEKYEELLQTARGEAVDANASVSVAQQLPEAHLNVLGLLLRFLLIVSHNAKQNMMTTSNLATCFAPSLLRAPENTSPHAVLSDMPVAIKAVDVLIQNATKFPNPKRTLGAAHLSVSFGPPRGSSFRGARSQLPDSSTSMMEEMALPE